EQGQAVSYERKIEICERAYGLLTEKAGYRPQDIIMDVNVLTVGTGISEHCNYAVDFIRAMEWIGQNLPGVLTSGGISNVSFAFRGNGPIREAMHTVFLYHAIKAGLDMGIVNAGMIGIYEDLPAGLLRAVEDVLFNRRPDATDRLLGFAAEVSADDKKGKTAEEWRKESVEERLSHALINGNTEYIDADALEALEKLGKPLSVIEGPLMNGMNRVGELFAAGKMFLPQVVKSARVMKKAVAVLQPYLEAGREKGQGSAAGKVLMATVKGDVHDIGKNIVSVVLGCNNYEIIDLGVMVPCEKIAEAVRREKPDIIGLSGLITPSLHEMEFNASEFEREGFGIPLMIGGATTSRVHTAVKINPLYKGPVVHVPDASQAVTVAGQLLNPKLNEGYKNDIEEEYAALRKNYLERSRKKEYLSIEQARANRFVPSYDEKLIKAPAHVGLSVFDDVPLEELFSLIDWTPFFRAWEMKGKYPAILQDGQTGVEATRLFSDAQKMLNSIGSEKWLQAKAVAGIWPANSCGDDILLYSSEDRDEVLATVHCLRQQGKKAPSAPNLSLADFIAPAGSSVADYLGAFAVTAGLGIEKKLSEFEEAGDDYNSILLKALSDRLAEALAEWLHMKVRKELWAYQADESLDNDALIREEYRGIRPAPGYPACPDHQEKITLWTLLDARRNTRIRLTENLAM
ncbi:MAG: vitamin B12 dependent-methionine synthase activation domain-containing protein, partial [Flavobacteriales bacterium]